MCVPRRLTRRVMLGFVKWKQELNEEDMKEFGEIIERPISAYQDLYRTYLDNNK